jgi:RNA polymerase sigma-70 factor (sigma-E family)
MGFEDWARTNLAGLLRFAMVLCCDAGVAEDMVQEALIRAHRRWDHIRTVDWPEAYVRRMIVNDYLRWRRKWSRYVPSGDVRPIADVPDPAEHHADRAELIAELAKLPPRQRAVLALRYYADMSDAEIAEILSCRQVTVRTQASRALAKLRVELGADRSVVTFNQAGADHAH